MKCWRFKCVLTFPKIHFLCDYSILKSFLKIKHFSFVFWQVEAKALYTKFYFYLHFPPQSIRSTFFLNKFHLNMLEYNQNYRL